MRCYEADNAPQKPPLRLEACIERSGDGFIVMEPLPQLLSAACRCIYLYAKKLGASGGTDVSSPIRELQKHMDTLVSRMRTADLEEFQLDKVNIPLLSPLLLLLLLLSCLRLCETDALSHRIIQRRRNKGNTTTKQPVSFPAYSKY